MALSRYKKINLKVLLMAIPFVFSCGNENSAISDDPASDLFCNLMEETLSSGAIYNCSNEKIPDSQVGSEDVAWLKLSYNNESHKFYNGVGRYGTCTGALIETNGNDSSPAYILTNGHCLGKLLPEEGVLFDKFIENKLMLFNTFYDSTGEQFSYSTQKIKYATMDKNDIAIIELEGVTLGTLKQLGFNAYEISQEEPLAGILIENVGIPATGLSSSEKVLRKSVCTLNGTVNVQEGVYNFATSYKHNCSIVGGSSGSPIFNRQTHEIIAVNNTTVNDSAGNQEDCSINKPCEIIDQSIKTNVFSNYAQPVWFLSSCFTDEGVFDRLLESCSLKDLVSLNDGEF
ncbi:MAG: hypothetical protein CMP11_07110 [Zetaproteobacteria bacterium]|nr:hypothetical protein [Pseudobdellovibrionaceae bacterium]|tara:strand:+ start:2066 stop:3097 length:1032 start_codon:yes stop_codon:yes gene_type:complete